MEKEKEKKGGGKAINHTMEKRKDAIDTRRKSPGKQAKVHSPK